MTTETAILPEGMPEFLDERCRIVSSGDVPKEAEFVLYWMCTALRVDENPALDAARWTAVQTGLPLVIYHGLSETYRYASDRHHQFILQGARDVQAAFQAAGLTSVFVAEQRGERPDTLRLLADRAAVVFTEEMPTAPVSLFLRGLASRTTTPIVAVDTACLVPIQLSRKAWERAFQFREHVADEIERRIHRAWPSLECDVQPFPGSLPQSMDLQSADLSAIIAECHIDHSVGPVVDTPGGFLAAERRWTEFLQRGISAYAAKRNDPLQDSVSRMSAYLHYGMISPFRMARDAARLPGKGPEKYLDELIIWRELAWSFCFHREDHDQWTALPGWARQSLIEHADDPRRSVYTWEQLARGMTGDELWNTAQQSLLIHGELHNNVRMTWGKAVLQWTQSPQRALDVISDLNNRYALDGRDPGSWGGLLWCLGQFDRPFRPEKIVLGRVRPRPTGEHARRLNVGEWKRRIRTPRCSSVPRCAVIGAGAAGLTAARVLQDHLLPVVVFEKSRGPGGRMATRRKHSEGIDHGAPWFRARNEWFRRHVQSWSEQGLVDRWRGSFAFLQSDGRLVLKQSTSRLVAVPGMNAIARHLAEGLDVRTEQQVTRLHRSGRRWQVEEATGKVSEPFDRLILALPGPQLESLLVASGLLPEHQASLRSDAVVTLMLCLPEPLRVEWNALEFEAGPLQHVLRNQTKPGRRGVAGEELVLHSRATADGEDPEQRQRLGAILRDCFRDVTQHQQQPVWEMLHWWRFAQPQSGGAAWSPSDWCSDGIFCCGDWQEAGRPSCCAVESAFLSGQAAAGGILRGLNAAVPQQQTLFGSEL